MPDRLSREEKMGVVQAKLEAGVREIFSSEKYQEYINAMSKFKHYSINNCILIASQKPDASLVCGFKAWQKDFNRTVNKGEKGIMILAPFKGKVNTVEDVYDELGHLIRDENGAPKTEEVERTYCTFRPVYVFDVSQTSGDPVPTLVEKLDRKVEGFTCLRGILEEISPVPIFYEEIKGSANGYFSNSEGRIVIEESLPELQMVKTMIHEIAHASLGHGSKEDKTDRYTKEVQAESVAYWVSQMIGLDTSDYSFGYISGWSKDKEVSELKESLEIIKSTADEISSMIESKLEEISKEKEMPLVAEENEEYKTARHKKGR